MAMLVITEGNLIQLAIMTKTLKWLSHIIHIAKYCLKSDLSFTHRTCQQICWRNGHFCSLEQLFFFSIVQLYDSVMLHPTYPTHSEGTIPSTDVALCWSGAVELNKPPKGRKKKNRWNILKQWRKKKWKATTKCGPRRIAKLLKMTPITMVYGLRLAYNGGPTL